MRPLGRPLTPSRPELIALLTLCRDQEVFLSSVVGEFSHVLYPLLRVEEVLRAHLIHSTEACHHPDPHHLGFQAATSHHWCPACGAIRRVWCGGAEEWQVPGRPTQDTP